MRDHQTVLIEEFKGLFKRGTQDSVPLDHFTDCNNVKYTYSGFKTRDGIDPAFQYANVVRIYAFNQSLLVLDTNGNIFHTDRASPNTPILHIDGMTDFHIAKFATRVYITPNGPTNEFIYVYEYGDAAGARKAAGVAPGAAPTLTTGGAGHTEKGVHIVAVAFETSTGFITNLSPGASITVDGTTSIDVTIPIGGAFVVARHVVATKAVDPADFTGNLDGYQFFFVKRIADNSSSSTNIDFYDAELLDDASHLEDLFEEIPNCGGLVFFHNRLVLWSFPQSSNEISDIRVSDAGEPEAVNQVDGLISVPRDGSPITACWQYRDVLYTGKTTKTSAITDNDDVPSTWPIVEIDHGIGPTSSHQVAIIMDVGATTTEAIIIGHISGLFLFDGTYRKPELSWKVEDVWEGINEIHVNTNKKHIYVLKSNGTILYADYGDGLDAENIKWGPWSYDVKVTTMAILLSGGNDTVYLGSQQLQS